MPWMKYDAISLMAKGARALAAEGDGGTAFALFEMANNLRLLIRGDATVEQWKNYYTGEDAEPFDCDKEVDAVRVKRGRGR